MLISVNTGLRPKLSEKIKRLYTEQSTVFRSTTFICILTFYDFKKLIPYHLNRFCSGVPAGYNLMRISQRCVEAEKKVYKGSSLQKIENDLTWASAVWIAAKIREWLPQTMNCALEQTARKGFWKLQLYDSLDLCIPLCQTGRPNDVIPVLSADEVN